MSKLKETVTTDMFLANCLLGSMNEKLYWVAPEKKDVVHTFMYAMAYEIFSAFNIQPSIEFVNLTQDKQLKSFKLFASNTGRRGHNSAGTIPCPKWQATPQYLNERIRAACVRKEILILLLEDTETLMPIVIDLIKIIDQFLAAEGKRNLNLWWGKQYAILADEKTPTIKSEWWKSISINHTFFEYDKIKSQYTKSHDPYMLHSNLLKPSPEKPHIINYTSFFNISEKKRLNPAFANNQVQIFDHLAREQRDLFNHAQEDFLSNLVRLLKNNLTIVRFLLVLVDNDGNRLMPLTQPNLIAVCTAIAGHQADLHINADRLDRLYYLCSQSKKFSCQVINWMRMYEQHCAANDTPTSFPELLLTYCANFPEHVDNNGPLPLQIMCAKLVRDHIPRHQVPYVVALELVDEESVLANGIGDDQNVVALLSNLINQPSQTQHLRIGM